MASSWYAQIPTILTLFRELQPRSVLDVGKGLGKYGFLIHEYFGLDDTQRPDPGRPVIGQSRIPVDAVESEQAFLWPHLEHFYRKVYIGRVETLLDSLPSYHLVLMCDVIEHLEKEAGLRTLRHFLACGAIVIVSSPIDYFRQENWGSADEAHVSHWTPADFSFCFCQWQRVGSSRIYVVSQRQLHFKTFGRGPIRRLKRIAHAFQDELL
jgi:hypothetical protein